MPSLTKLFITVITRKLNTTMNCSNMSVEIMPVCISFVTLIASIFFSSTPHPVIDLKLILVLFVLILLIVLALILLLAFILVLDLSLELNFSFMFEQLDITLVVNGYNILMICGYQMWYNIHS